MAVVFHTSYTAVLVIHVLGLRFVLTEFMHILNCVFLFYQEPSTPFAIVGLRPPYYIDFIKELKISVFIAAIKVLCYQSKLM